MQTERKIFKNTFLLSAGRGFGDLCSFIFLAYFARVFGTATLGKYAFAMSLGGLLTIFAGLGFNTLTIREISRDEDKSNKYVGNLLVATGGLSVLIWCLIGLGALCSHLHYDTKLILFMISGYHIFYGLTGQLRASFMAHDQVQHSALLEFYHKVFILICGATCIMVFSDPVITLAAYPVSTITMFILGLTIYKIRYGWPEFYLDYQFIKNSIFKAFPFFLIIIMGQFYDRIGIVFLTFLKGEVNTGIFSASDRLLVTIFAGITIFSSVLFPYMSKFSTQSKDQLHKLCKSSMRFIFVVVLSISIVIFILSKQIILITFGDNFIESIKVLQLLIWSLLFMGLNQIISSLLIVTDQEKRLVKIRATAYFGYCVVSLLLIWKYSYVGLACAKILTEAVLFCTTVFYAFSLSHIYDLIRLFIAPLSSCFLSLLLYSFISDLTIWITLPTVLGVYISAMFLFKGIFIHDFRYLNRIVFNNKNG